MKIGLLTKKLLTVPDTWNKGTEALIIDGVLYIKGSDDTKDWLVNFLACSAFYHFGFHSEAMKISHKIDENVDEKISLVCGHSAGAAIGHLVGYYLGLPSIGFGCPNYFARAHLPAMAEYLDNYTLNIDLQFDIVPKVPFWYDRGKNTVNGTSFKPFEHKLTTYQKVFGKYHLSLIDGHPKVMEI